MSYGKYVTGIGWQPDPPEKQVDRTKVYVIGSLRNENVPCIAEDLRNANFDVFDDWYAAGPEADDYWKKYEQGRGRSYAAALNGFAAKNVFAFDKRNIDAADVVVLVLPAGKSGHLEFGYAVGSGKRGYILLDDVERWDVMYQFATGVVSNIDDLLDALEGEGDAEPQNPYG